MRIIRAVPYGKLFSIKIVEDEIEAHLTAAIVMGIRKLETFMKQSDYSVWEHDVVVKGTLVLDGNAVLFNIYKEVNISWCQGGQYGEFRTATLNFIDRLMAGNKITPIFVFDGIHNPQKLPTKLYRHIKNFIRIRDSLDAMTQGGDPTDDIILSVLSKEVFCDALNEREISFFYADGEADPVIAALAEANGCPVVSNDSDFYIFNITNGYIPLDRLKFNSDSSVIADVYYQERFCSAIGLKALELCFAIPVCMGTDSIKRVEIHGGENSIESSLKSLITFDSVEDLLGNITDQDQRERFEQAYTAAKKFYQVEPVGLESLKDKTALRYSDDTEIPPWLLKKYRKGYFASSLMEALVRHTSLLRVVPDDPHKETALRCSRFIRQAIYGILERPADELCSIAVIELERESGQKERKEKQTEICKTRVDRVYTVEDVLLPDIWSIDRESLNVEKRKSVLCKILGCSVDLVESVEKKWQLVVAASSFWAKRANPSENQIKALVFTFLCCSESNGIYSGEIPPLKLPVPQNWMESFHCYAQWQCVYKDSMMLNNILMNPLGQNVSPAFLFNGKLVMYMCHSNQKVDTIEPRKQMLYDRLVSIITSARPAAVTHPVPVTQYPKLTNRFAGLPA